MPNKNKYKEENWELGQEVSKLFDQIKILNGKLDEMSEDRKKNDEAWQEVNKKRDEISKNLDEIEEDVQEIKKQIGEVFQEKEDAKEAYYKQKYEYELQKEEVNFRERNIKIQKRMKDEKEEAENRKEQARIERENRPHPYESQMELCLYLKSWCKRQLDKKSAEQDAKDKKEVIQAEATATHHEIQKEVKDGRIEIYEKKEEEGTQFGGGSKKNKKQRKKKQLVQKQVVTDPDALNLDYQMLNHFANLKLRAPNKISQLEGTITEIEKAREELLKRGIDELEDENVADDGEEKKDKEDKPKKKSKAQAIKLEVENQEDFPELGED